MSRLWRSVARNKAELIVLVRLWPAGRSAVQGVEFLDAARAANRPILGIVLHLGNWEVMGVACQAIGYGRCTLFAGGESIRKTQRESPRALWRRPYSGRAWRDARCGP